MDYETEQVSLRLNSQLRCLKDKRHPVEFVCTFPDCLEDRLVCIDCIKTNSTHLQAHGHHFKRINEFLQSLSFTLASEADFKLLKIVSDHLDMAIDNAEKQKLNQRKLIDQYFEAFQNSIIDSVKKTLAEINSKCRWIADSTADKHIKDLEKVKEEGNELMKFRNKGQILDLYLLMEKPDSQTAVRKKIDNLIQMSSGLQFQIDDYLQTQSDNRRKGLFQSPEFNPPLEFTHGVVETISGMLMKANQRTDWEGCMKTPAYRHGSLNSTFASPSKDPSANQMDHLEQAVKARKKRLAEIDQRITSLML